MKHTEAQEARITVIMAERGCTRGNALKHLKKEEAKATKAARAAAKVGQPKLTLVEKIQATNRKLQARIEKNVERLQTIAARELEQGATDEEKAAAKATKAAERTQAKADAKALKAANQLTKAQERAEAKQIKLDQKAEAKQAKLNAREEKKAAKAAANANKVSNRKVLDTAAIVEMYKAQQTIAQICKTTGASYMGIRLLLIRENVFGTVAPAPKPVKAPKAKVTKTTSPA